MTLLAACGGGAGGGIGGGTTTLPVAPTPTPGATAPPMGPLVTIPIHGLAPLVMAYQSGTSGAWTKLTVTGNAASFNLAVGATAYSVAAYCPPNNNVGQTVRSSGPAEIIIQATTADAPTMFCHPPSGGYGTVPATVFVSATSFPNTDHFTAAQVSNAIPGFFSPGFGGAAGVDEFGSPLWNAAPSDLIVDVTNSTGTMIAGRIVRNVTLTPNQTMTLNPVMSSTDAVTTTPITLPSGATGSNLFWQPAEGGNFYLGGGGLTPSLPLIPNAAAGDSYEIATYGSGGQQTFEGVGTASPASATLPAFCAMPFTITGPVSQPDLFSANVAYTGFTVSGTKYYSISPYWTTSSPWQSVVAGAPLVTIVASQSYLGTGTTITLPDLSSVPGFLPPPTGGTSTSIIAQDYVASGPFAWDNMTTGNSFFYAPLAAGSTFQEVQSNYITFNAP